MGNQPVVITLLLIAIKKKEKKSDDSDIPVESPPGHEMHKRFILMWIQKLLLLSTFA